MQSIVIIRITMLILFAISFIFLLIGFAKRSTANAIETEQIQSRFSTLVIFCSNNKKAAAAALIISSAIYIGTYYQEIGDFINEHLLQKKIETYKPINFPEKPASKQNAEKDVAPVNLFDSSSSQSSFFGPQSEAEKARDASRTLRAYSSRDKQSNRLESGSQNEGFFAPVKNFVGSLVNSAKNFATRSAVDIFFPEKGYINGFNRNTLLANPILKDPDNPESYTLANKASLALSAASLTNYRTPILNAIAFVNNNLLNRDSESNAKEAPEKEDWEKRMDRIIYNQFAPFGLEYDSPPKWSQNSENKKDLGNSSPRKSEASGRLHETLSERSFGANQSQNEGGVHNSWARGSIRGNSLARSAAASNRSFANSAASQNSGANNSGYSAHSPSGQFNDFADFLII